MPPPIDSPIMGAAFRVASAYPGGAKALDVRMGKPIGTLSQQLRDDPERTAKLGLKDALTISKLADDPDILHTFAQELGYMVVPVPLASPRGDSIALMTKAGRMAQDFAMLMAEVVESSADGDISDNELSRIQAGHAALVADALAVVAAAQEAHRLMRVRRGLTLAGEGAV